MTLSLPPSVMSHADPVRVQADLHGSSFCPKQHPVRGNASTLVRTRALASYSPVWHALCGLFNQVCRIQFSPRFDRARFLEACGM